MVKIKLRVPAGRDRTALVEVTGGSVMPATGVACASADAVFAKRNGNPDCDPLRPWGHPPLGRYRMIASGRTPKECGMEYGSHMFVFQPESGPALEAESFGRLLLPLYGSPTGMHEPLRRTQGGVRVDQHILAGLLASSASDPDVRLEIDTLDPPAWWQFWRHAEHGAALAGAAAKFQPAPLDELSIAQALAAGKRFAPGKASKAADDDDFLRSRDSDRSSSSSSGSDTSYTGRGGESGGAGASGSWDAPRGVDSAGRITAAAAGVAAGVAAAHVLSSGERAGGDAFAAAAFDAGAEPGTSTSTSY